MATLNEKQDISLLAAIEGNFPIRDLREMESLLVQLSQVQPIQKSEAYSLNSGESILAEASDPTRNSRKITERLRERRWQLFRKRRKERLREKLGY